MTVLCFVQLMCYMVQLLIILLNACTVFITILYYHTRVLACIITLNCSSILLTLISSLYNIIKEIGYAILDVPLCLNTLIKITSDTIYLFV